MVELLRAGGATAALGGALLLGAFPFGVAPQLSAAESSVLTKSYGADSARSAAATTVFRQPSTKAASDSSAALAATGASKPKGDAAPLQWRVRASSSHAVAKATANAPTNAPTMQRHGAANAPSSVRQAQYEAERIPAAERGPVLRAANESVLLPATPPSKTPSTAPSASTRRLTPANPQTLRNVQQGAGDGVLPRQPRGAEPLDDAAAASVQPNASDLPSEALTQPDAADGIFGDQPPASDPPVDIPPSTTAPPTTAPPTTTPRDDLPPPGRLPMPDESPMPMTPFPMVPRDGPSANEREAEMNDVLFGPIGEDGQRLGGELGECLKTNIEVTNKVVANIGVNISPPAHDSTSTWSYDRPWKDITGKTLFTGRPIALDATAGEATFKTVDGLTRRVKLRDLSRIEQGFFLAMYPLPVECHLIDEPYRGRNWIASTYTWKASAACHKPLYFEDVHLERYGHSWGPFMQPVMSSAHFFGTLPILPYKMGMHTPNECIYTLGYYRPGNCAPYMLDPLPISARGALFEAGAWIGGVAIIP